MKPKTKKIIGLSVAAAYIVLCVVLFFVKPAVLAFGAASFVAGGLSLYFYENGKLKASTPPEEKTEPIEQ